MMTVVKLVVALLAVGPQGKLHKTRVVELQTLKIPDVGAIVSNGRNGKFFVEARKGGKDVIYTCREHEVISSTPYDGRHFGLVGTNKQGLPILKANSDLVALTPGASPGAYRDDSFTLHSIKRGVSMGSTIDGQMFFSWLKDSPYVWGGDNDQVVCARVGLGSPSAVDLAPSGELGAMVFGGNSLTLCSVPIAIHHSTPQPQVVQVKSTSGAGFRWTAVEGFCLISDTTAVILIPFESLHPIKLLKPTGFTDNVNDPDASSTVSLCRISLQTGLLEELTTLMVRDYSAQLLAGIDSNGTVAVIAGRNEVRLYRIVGWQ